mmetsp:Transcript_93343/g.267063  ORF Transcript_93343/g.267063 Transcript_93343/m.267063 type:complete len:319 (-) Transcript_93343:3002-3958(-)
MRSLPLTPDHAPALIGVTSLTRESIASMTVGRGFSLAVVPVSSLRGSITMHISADVISVGAPGTAPPLALGSSGAAFEYSSLRCASTWMEKSRATGRAPRVRKAERSSSGSPISRTSGRSVTRDAPPSSARGRNLSSAARIGGEDRAGPKSRSISFTIAKSSVSIVSAPASVPSMAIPSAVSEPPANMPPSPAAGAAGAAASPSSTPSLAGGAGRGSPSKSPTVLPLWKSPFSPDSSAYLKSSRPRLAFQSVALLLNARNAVHSLGLRPCRQMAGMASLGDAPSSPSAVAPPSSAASPGASEPLVTTATYSASPSGEI